MKNQRTRYKNGLLLETQTQLLEKLNNWSCTPMKDKWLYNYNKLKTLIQDNQKYPTNHTDSSLCKWIYLQKKNKLNNALVDKYVKMLESLPNWSWKIQGNDWGNMYQQLKLFVDTQNKYPPRRSKTQKEALIGIWCQNQRKKRKKRKNGKLSEKHIKLLEQLPGWYWDKKNIWNIKFNELKQYFSTNKKISHKDNKSIYTWCIEQRRAYRNKNRDDYKHKMTDERIKLLESLPEWRW